MDPTQRMVVVRRAVALALAASMLSCAAGKVNQVQIDTSYLTELEEEIIREINLARTTPMEYVPHIAQYLPYFEYKRLDMPGKAPVRTAEGAKAPKAAIEYLERAAPVQPLQPSRGMSYASEDHVADMGPIGAIGHMGMDESTTGDRLNRYGKWSSFTGEKIGEVMTYGAATAREIVVQLIVDDGVTSRVHRTTLFEPSFRFVGVSFGPHAQFGSVCVITFASSYIEN